MKVSAIEARNLMRFIVVEGATKGTYDTLQTRTGFEQKGNQGSTIRELTLPWCISRGSGLPLPVASRP